MPCLYTCRTNFISTIISLQHHAGDEHDYIKIIKYSLITQLCTIHSFYFNSADSSKNVRTLTTNRASLINSSNITIFDRSHGPLSPPLSV